MSCDEVERVHSGGNSKGARLGPFMDPLVCPVCSAPATVVFGARNYCYPCARERSVFIRQIRGAAR